MVGPVLLLVAGLLAAPARAELSVMTWNVCAGTNSACPLYRASPLELAQSIGGYAVKNGPPDVIFLQEFCTGAAGTLELWLEQRTGRNWTIGSWGLTSHDGTPYACHPDRLGRPRGAQSIAVAVAGDATFETDPLPAPPWYVTRAVLCATVPARKVRACGTHLSSGRADDDRRPGAPYRTRQIRRLLEIAAKPGLRTILGGDLNVSPPDSGYGSAAGRRAVAPLYRAYQECDQRGARRTGRQTREGKKLDYLFAPKGTVRGCRVAKDVTLSDHKPVHVKVAL
ncbi:endonuclease/exonuclease/phosphatase family protein [Nonomuraea sp. NPDC050451]|uniref:endonuclease/exonuclease/phosphatase family protein n=1 Tax=Nonomuraea sp. NPDC050451 TaxID=3364364 RepID=UPI0037AAF7D2